MIDKTSPAITDPQPGDVVHRGERHRAVISRHGGDIWYDTKEGGPLKNCWITTWQDWAKKADLVHVAERATA